MGDGKQALRPTDRYQRARKNCQAFVLYLRWSGCLGGAAAAPLPRDVPGIRFKISCKVCKAPLAPSACEVRDACDAAAEHGGRSKRTFSRRC